MNIARNISRAILPFLLLCALPATARTIQDFDANWLFSKGDFPTAMMRDFADSAWQPVSVPTIGAATARLPPTTPAALVMRPAALAGIANIFNSTPTRPTPPSRSNSMASMTTPKSGSTASSPADGPTVIPVSNATSRLSLILAATTSWPFAWIIRVLQIRVTILVRASTGMSDWSSRTNFTSRTGAFPSPPPRSARTPPA